MRGAWCSVLRIIKSRATGPVSCDPFGTLIEPSQHAVYLLVKHSRHTGPVPVRGQGPPRPVRWKNEVVATNTTNPHQIHSPGLTRKRVNLSNEGSASQSVFACLSFVNSLHSAHLLKGRSFQSVPEVEVCSQSY